MMDWPSTNFSYNLSYLCHIGTEHEVMRFFRWGYPLAGCTTVYRASRRFLSCGGTFLRWFLFAINWWSLAG